MAFALKTDGAAPCKVGGLKPEILLAAMVLDGVMASVGIDYWHITEFTGAVHGKGSKHYIGEGMDVRLPSRYSTKPNVDEVVAARARQALGVEYDVVVEGNHLHVEFDPPPATPPVA